ncbi:hypothetical protein NIES806_04920 [Dolichospermum compactum NIES-806]|uniref:Uncharacterized protein n=1 Tax=Dolichospermum compactum NIES-806 TaxID=1973481 RepID=A0A1Z4UYH5_9CYAN|nr:hypothetical protein NIES806_04920 [Dolichospermum compactum NIES-806]
MPKQMWTYTVLVEEEYDFSAYPLLINTPKETKA